MTTQLNVKTCANNTSGRDHFEAITIYGTRVQFSSKASKLLQLNEGDRVVFELKDGTLRLKFDSQVGFEIKIKKGKGENSRVIYNTRLARSLVKIAGKKIIVGEFSDGGYELIRYKVS